MSSRPAWTTYTVRPFKKTNHGNCEVCCANKSTIISKGSSRVIEKMKKQSVDVGSASLLSPIQLNAYSEKVKVCLKTWKNKVIRMHLLPITYSVRLMNESDLWMCPRTELVYKSGLTILQCHRPRVHFCTAIHRSPGSACSSLEMCTPLPLLLEEDGRRELAKNPDS